MWAKVRPLESCSVKNKCPNGLSIISGSNAANASSLMSAILARRLNIDGLPCVGVVSLFRVLLRVIMLGAVDSRRAVPIVIPA